MTIRITWLRAAIALAAIGAAGMLFAWSGLFNVAASSGHWRITSWFLHWTMRNSVRTHAAFGTPDAVIDTGGLVSAAGHFAQTCASCHGAPGVPPLPAMQRATPPAPDLTRIAGKYSDRELFWIVQHGVKFTGMPAWAASDRPDEVRRMVAFLRRLPGMSAAEYRALSGTERGLGCASCHGADGRGRGQRDIPILAGQDPDYLVAALADYAAGRRESAVMAQAAATLRPGDRRTMAALFAAKPGLGARPGGGGDARARMIAERGLPRAQLPACASCHRPGGRAPVIAGQRPGYIAQRLRQWRGEETVVDARKPQDTMAVIARRIPEEAIAPLALYYGGAERGAAR